MVKVRAGHRLQGCMKQVSSASAHLFVGDVRPLLACTEGGDARRIRGRQRECRFHPSVCTTCTSP